jgi:hypothetical protein
MKNHPAPATIKRSGRAPGSLSTITIYVANTIPMNVSNRDRDFWMVWRFAGSVFMDDFRD